MPDILPACTAAALGPRLPYKLVERSPELVECSPELVECSPELGWRSSMPVLVAPSRDGAGTDAGTATVTG